LKCDEPEFSDGKKTATFKHCEFQVADEMIYKSNAPQFFVDDIPPSLHQEKEKQAHIVCVKISEDHNSKSKPIYECKVQAPDSQTLASYISHGIESSQIPYIVRS
jgi:hypothetical protein